MRQILKLKPSAFIAGAVILSMAITTKATTTGATYELVATSTNDPNGVISSNGQSVTLSTPGSQISLSLYMVLSGSNSTATDDGALNIKGSFVGPSSGLLGNFTVGAQAANFGGPTSQNGTLINSNNTNPASLNLGDDTTLGTAASVPSDAFIATSTNSGNNTPTFGTSLDSSGNTDILIGTTTFTLLSSDANGTGSLTFIPSFATGVAGRNQKFTIDGNTYAVNALGTGLENGSTNATGALAEQSLSIAFSPAPEPASLGILALGGIAMLRRRRPIP